MNCKELWADIADAPNHQVSNHGRVRHIRTKKTLTPYVNERSANPINKVKIRIRGKIREVSVARLTAANFVNDIPKGWTVRHKNGNTLDDRAENLEIFDPERSSEESSEKPANA